MRSPRWPGIITPSQKVFRCHFGSRPSSAACFSLCQYPIHHGCLSHRKARAQASAEKQKDAKKDKTQNKTQDLFNDHWEYSLNVVSIKDQLMDTHSVKGSQFQDQLMEFSGACSGCGETPYVKLLTQMFGDRVVIANSSGCSSVWGGSYSLSPFKKNRFGQGPAWARSLFEDTAEYGLGMALASMQRHERLIQDVKELLQEAED